MRKTNRSKSHSLHAIGAAAALAAAATLAPLHHASASTFKILYSFCSQANCADGASPQGRLLMDSAGNLYGTTSGLSAGNSGTVFEMVKTGSTYTHQVLYNFCSQANCTDGDAPIGHLIMDVNGNLYGTTSSGGAGSVDSLGTVFKLHPNRNRTKWPLTTLYNFCSAASCADGAEPYYGLTYAGAEAGALYDGRSTLYGTAGYGASGNGVAFQMKGRRHTYRVIYNFCSQPNCTDGRSPGELIVDASRNLYGPAGGGGSSDHGIVFELSLNGKAFTENVLYTFCQLSACEDGSAPSGALTFGAGGALLGPTVAGGSEGYGVIFKLTPNGSSWQENRLYNFAGGGLDGAYPADKLFLDASGNLFGTAQAFYYGNGGTVFELSGTTLTALHDFCSDGGSCTSDGQSPHGVVGDSSGNLFGVVTFGGPNGAGGLVYEISP